MSVAVHVENKNHMLFDRNYVVILHNDDSIFAGTVVDAIMEIVGISFDEANDIMLKAHTEGKATIIETNKIVANIYKDQLEERGLTISVEKCN